MKRATSSVLFVFIVISVCMINLSAFGAKEDLTTQISFITDVPEETAFVNNLDTFLEDDNFVSENKIEKQYMIDLLEVVKMNEAQKSNKLMLNDLGETIAINYDLFKNQGVLKSAKDLIDEGKTIIFYGKNINLRDFCMQFDMEYAISDKLEILKSEERDLFNSDVQEGILCLVGVEKHEFGNVLITSESTDYNFYEQVYYLLKQAQHAKKYKVTKPYTQLRKDDAKNSSFWDKVLNTVNAADISSFPTVNSQRKSKSFLNWYDPDFQYKDRWYIITDCDLHRDGDYSDDPTYDYFILETISEFDNRYTNYWYIANKFYTKLQPYYSADTVRDGGPGDQGGTTSIYVSLYPPSIGFNYDPGSKMSVDSTLSLSNNYFEALYSDATFLGFFDDVTIHRTSLSFRNYSPNSSYTYVKTNIYQKGYCNDSDVQRWEWAYNPVQYYYDYEH